MKYSAWRLLIGASILSMCLVFGSANAQYYDPVASPVVQGSYTVTWVPDCGSLSWGYCAFTVLQERRSDSATWSNVSSGVITGWNIYEHPEVAPYTALDRILEAVRP